MLFALPCDIEDRYTIVAELGHGSHAIVYRAIDRSLDREVAIKVLRPELVDSEVSERFRREIRLTSQLEHPHIAHVYGTGEFMGTPYFVTALARGASLAERLSRERQLPVEEALSITKQVASALGHAHRAGIIHRDVKPANILLTPDGALLTDFGVARVLEYKPGTLATSTGVAVGTLLYMSPEQLCAEKGIDARSDQYALALVLYEMLAGVSAHVAANAEGLRALRIVGQHTPVRLLRTNVAKNVDAALNRALSATPADRFESMAAFVQCLDVVASILPSSRTSTGGTGARFVRVRPPVRRMIAGLAILGILMSSGFGASSWLNARERRVPELGEFSASYIVMADGNSVRDEEFAQTLAAELRAWPEVSAETSRRWGASTPTHVLTHLVSVPGGYRVNLALRMGARDSAHSRMLSVQIPAETPIAADSLKLLAARILLASVVPPDSVENVYAVSTRSTQAVQSYALGWRALLDGRIDSSAARFTEASRRGGIPQAVLWRAVMQSWQSPKAEATWRAAARDAAERSHELLPADSLLAAGLWLRSSGHIQDACNAFVAATAVQGGSFAAWYGLASCIQRDSIVIRDRNSPTGVRFRSSYWEANHAFEEALARLPSPNLVRLFNDAPSTTLALNGRLGWAALDGRTFETFAGLPTLIGDSVTVFPRATRLLVSGSTQNVPSTYARAVAKGRERLVALARLMAQRAPASVYAQITFARALEYAGYLGSEAPTESALAVLRQAALLARQPRDSIEIGAAEIRVRLRLADFSGAGRAAAALLAVHVPNPSREDAEQLASIAVLVGRATLAESLLVTANSLSPDHADGLPEAIARSAAGYTVASAVGDCATLHHRRSVLQQFLAEHYSPAELPAMRERWISPGDWMGLTCAGAPVPIGASTDEPLIGAFVALSGHDLARTTNAVRQMQQGREGATASAVSWDTRYAELWLLVSAGDSAGAREQLRGARRNLASMMDYVLVDVVRATGFRRSLQLCEGLQANEAVALPEERWCGAALRALSAGRG